MLNYIIYWWSWLSFLDPIEPLKKCAMKKMVRFTDCASVHGSDGTENRVRESHDAECNPSRRGLSTRSHQSHSNCSHSARQIIPLISPPPTAIVHSLLINHVFTPTTSPSPLQFHVLPFTIIIPLHYRDVIENPNLACSRLFWFLWSGQPDTCYPRWAKQKN